MGTLASDAVMVGGGGREGADVRVGEASAGVVRVRDKG